MTKKNQYGHEIVKVEFEISKAYKDHLLEWADKHHHGCDDVGDVFQFVTRLHMEQVDKERKQLLDDETKGFINGYAMGGKHIPNNSASFTELKWLIPHTLKAEALEQMCHLHRELS